MNPTKKTIEGLEGKFNAHEIWARAEIKQVLNQSWLDSESIAEFDDSIEEKLKTLIKDIKEIPDGDVDRYLIIDEIEKIIKELPHDSR